MQPGNASPRRALAETCLIGGVLMAGLLAVADQFPPAEISQGMLFIGGGAAIWFGLRLRTCAGSPGRKAAFELLNALALGLTIIILLPAGMRLLGLLDPGQVFSPMGFSLFSLPVCLPVFAVLRAGRYSWAFWDGLRRKRLLWSLIYGQLSAVALVALGLAVIGAFYVVYHASRTFPFGGSFPAALVDRLVLTVLPYLGVVLVLLAGALVCLLPPTALAAYWFSRRVTRRLEELAEGTRRLRAGEYGARLRVSGEDEVAGVQADFNSMAERLERALGELQAERDRASGLLEAQRQLTASVSHELRTPLATIQGHLERALQELGQAPLETLEQHLRVEQRELARLERLVDDLLSLSQTELRRLSLKIRPVEVTPVIQRMHATFQPLAWRQARVEVIADPPVGPGETGCLAALVDEDRLEQILANLLRNAIRHTPPGGIVAMAAKADGERVRLEVRDTGEGIPAGDLEQIWERFYRGESEAGEQEPGAGLGLALVKELAEAMGGSVGVFSQPGEGSRFSIWLPMART